MTATDAHAAIDDGSDPNHERLTAWLSQYIPGFDGRIAVSKFAGGQSNPTFKITSRSGEFVLRRKPFGKLLPKAHMIEREFRVLSALGRTDFPVPAVRGLCGDHSVIGAPFYVMDFVEGRIFWDPSLPGVAAADRAHVFDAMNGLIARLHSFKPEELGLGDYGRPEGFMTRQVGLWTSQYRAAETGTIDAMESLIDWLPLHVPGQGDSTIFHGDLRLDNMIFHPTEPRIVALLDWELSTLGDPIADFAYHAMIWRIPPQLFRGLDGQELDALGIPTLGDYLRRYCDRTGRAVPDNWDFYLAFGLFRLAAILQGIAKRAQDGNASAADAAELGARARPLAELGWTIAQSG